MNSGDYFVRFDILSLLEKHSEQNILTGFCQSDGFSLPSKILANQLEIANKANVRHLVFYHLTPAPRNNIMENMFVRGVNEVREEWTLSDDGTMVILPLNSDKIEIKKIN